ncbi:spermidine/putrescine ABC transporter permease PotC [Desulfobotulus sp. H1]|uniref:Spermidine/putrescine transport system permease protein PotC n=1 Tax=Desulfobotulus pelophilus TaxID=2823377 RepID=A0ABT3NBN5_9BACT|nr:spermidine/putrescine ABC transporter permease PotC [Desulfobotulus pelophilus]MCW7754874.1 spermidine/putrescine ABC transporter permease PotC [Desulfobotulus pelophilus]
MANRDQRLGRTLYMVMVYGFLYTPLVILIIYSFNAARYGSQWQGFTLDWYKALAANPMLLKAAMHTLEVALVSSCIATFIGTLAALAFYRYRFAGRKVLYTMVYIVMMSPDIVMGISLLILFILLGIPVGFITLVIAHVTFCLPFVVVTVYARISGFDHHVIEAAKDLGADEFQTFRRVILPMIMPAVLSGWLLSFTLSVDDVIVSFFVTSPSYEILPLRIYSMVRLGVKPEVNALSTLMFAITLVSVLASQWMIKERRQ